MNVGVLKIKLKRAMIQVIIKITCCAQLHLLGDLWQSHPIHNRCDFNGNTKTSANLSSAVYQSCSCIQQRQSPKI